MFFKFVFKKPFNFKSSIHNVDFDSFFELARLFRVFGDQILYFPGWRRRLYDKRISIFSFTLKTTRTT